MKKYFILILICFLSFHSYASGENKTVKRVETTQEDITNILRLLNINAYRYDLSSFTDSEYSLEGYIEEFKNGTTEEVIRFGVGSNWRDARGNENGRQVVFDQISIYTWIKNDSTAIFNFNIPGGGNFRFTEKLYPVEESGGTAYDCREIKIYPISDKDTKIPLLFFNSFWWDEENELIRSCMELQIEPDLSNEALKKISHYYILGIEISQQ